MQQEEENNLLAYIEKRIGQLNGLDPVVKQAWTDPLYC